MDVFVNSRRTPLRVLHPTANVDPPANPTARAPVASASLPATGLVTFADPSFDGGAVANMLMLGVVAEGLAGVDVRAVVTGWRRVNLTGVDLWFPAVLVDAAFDCSASATFTLLTKTMRAGDTITVAAGAGLEGSSSVIHCRQLDTVVDMAWLFVDLLGCELVDVQLSDVGGGSAATTANALYALL